MSTEISLTIYDGRGRKSQTHVGRGRFTVGRLLENDLALDDPHVALRHAVIESFDGAAFVSDCGTDTGTLVNGELVRGRTRLHDGDVITLGGTTELTVQLHHVEAEAEANAVTTHRKSSAQVSSRRPSRRFVLAVAASAALSVLVAAALLYGVSRRGGVALKEGGAVRGDAARPGALTESVERSRASDVVGAGANANELDEVERYALRVMREISNDPNPTLSREAVGEIHARVEGCRNSPTLGENLRSLKLHGLGRLSAAAERADLKPPLVVYAALAKMERDGLRGDPSEVAQALLPPLSGLRGNFGTELANDSLLVVAGLEGWTGRATHPLQTAIAELAKRRPESPATIRTVWFLREHQRLSAQSFDFVLRFLAVGVVAQNPRRFGVDADPLTFG